MTYPKKLIPRRYVNVVKNTLLFRPALLGRLSSIRLQKICFFYLPQVPNFGERFTYVKLGKKETVVNPNNYEIIFESDLPINLSDYNRCLLDYSGLYALYKNDMIKEEHMLLIHYDTQILHREWINIIRHFAKKGNVVFSEWPIDKERSEVARWVYKRIDDIFLATHGQTFLSFLGYLS